MQAGMQAGTLGGGGPDGILPASNLARHLASHLDPHLDLADPDGDLLERSVRLLPPRAGGGAGGNQGAGDCISLASPWEISRNQPLCYDEEIASDEPPAPPDLSRLRKQAGWLLVSLAVDPQVSSSVTSAGGVLALVNYTREGDALCQEEGAWALACLSGDQRNAAVILRAGALPQLLALSASSSPAVQLQAVWALANLAVDAEVKQTLHRLRAVPILVSRLERILLTMAEGSSLLTMAEGSSGRSPQEDGQALRPEAARPEVVEGSLQQLTRCCANLLVWLRRAAVTRTC